MPAGADEADYLVDGARPPDGRRRALARRRGGDRGQRRAGHESTGDPRHRRHRSSSTPPTSPAVPGQGDRPDRPVLDRLSPSPGLRATSSRPGAARSGSASPSPSRPRSTSRRSPAAVTLRESRAVPSPTVAAPARARGDPAVTAASLRGSPRCAIREPVTLAAVAFLLGLLVVVQIRTQAGGDRLASAVGPGPDAPRRQPERATTTSSGPRSPSLQRQLDALELAGTPRRDVRRGRSSADLSRIRAWAGLDPVAGRRHHDHRPRPDRRARVEDADQRAPQRRRRGDRDRRRPGRHRHRRSAGVPGSLSVDDTLARRPVHDPRDRAPGVADRLADPGRRHRRPARGDESGRRARHPADRSG